MDNHGIKVFMVLKTPTTLPATAIAVTMTTAAITATVILYSTEVGLLSSNLTNHFITLLPLLVLKKDYCIKTKTAINIKLNAFNSLHLLLLTSTAEMS
jgi:hypothetical protein